MQTETYRKYMSKTDITGTFLHNFCMVEVTNNSLVPYVISQNNYMCVCARAHSGH